MPDLLQKHATRRKENRMMTQTLTAGKLSPNIHIGGVIWHERKPYSITAINHHTTYTAVRANRSGRPITLCLPTDEEVTVTP